MPSKVALSSTPASRPAYISGMTTSTPPARLTAATTSRQWLKAKMGNSMPSRSQMRVCIISPGPPLRCEADGHALDAVDEVRTQPRHGSGQLDVGQPAQELFEHDLDLEAGEVGAETEVVTDAEGEVVVRVAAHVEAVGVREDLLVPVGGDVPQRHLLPLADLLTTELGI